MKKGYTLVELLGVIIVLTIIMTIVVVVMINIIKNTNERIDKATAKILYSASENYLASYKVNAAYRNRGALPMWGRSRLRWRHYDSKC